MENWKEDTQKYKEVIDKAIEYLEEPNRDSFDYSKAKLLDILNKIANGEEIPKKIKFNGNIYEYKWSNAWQKSCYINDDKYRLLDDVYLDRNLNEEIKIIEEPKKIEKIKSNGDEFYSDYIDTWISKNKTDAYCEFLMNKINELIDEINNLKEK